MERICVFVCGVLLLMSTASVGWEQKHDYKLALSTSLLFFEGQRSGKLPPNQRLTWRKDSALRDGQEGGVDLTGGYYDAGDNVKYSFPMAFTATMLAWSIIEFGDGMAMGNEWINAAEALRWNTDFLLKATAHLPNTVYAMVGNPNSDHICWERPEDMETPRPVYAVNTAHPGSEVAGEIAAALAAASIAFKTYDAAYSQRLLSKAKQADYILGSNPMGMSYMVGYGPKFPQHVHHRAASLPSVNAHPSFIACGDGFSYLNRPNPNMNELTGAIVGGPNSGTDNFADDRRQSAQTEPTTYVNAPFVGVFAYFVNHKK
ncbi:hypothetical protein ZIOFF_060993 [Zingiber officinale]|uniref:Endoglucanase n=1 Tax=Zingiber officinale TaxID=94328 RepID=A0A8J5FCE9_ZINOF|nr:hypothetical protein ZIOFF_060993 [Zingiber officinale]